MMTGCKPTLFKKGAPGTWTSENGNELQTARPTRARVRDEVTQEFKIISNVNANIECPQVNFQQEISDPDECAKAANGTLPDRSCKSDPANELEQTSTPYLRPMLDLEEAHGSSSSADSFTPVAGPPSISMAMKGHTTEQSMKIMTTVEDGERKSSRNMQQHSKLIDLLEAEHILQIRELSGHEEQHSRSFHETS